MNEELFQTTKRKQLYDVLKTTKLIMNLLVLEELKVTAKLSQNCHYRLAATIDDGKKSVPGGSRCRCRQR